MKKLGKVLLWIVGVILSIALIITVLNVIPVAPTSGKTSAFLTNGKTMNIPHGGAKELYPENTKFSFDKTSVYNVFEIDLSLTKDDILISHHDLSLASSLGTKGTAEEENAPLIRNLTLAEVNQAIIDTDYKFAREFRNPDNESMFDESKKEDFLPTTLDYMFETYPDAYYILEIKDTESESSKESSDIASENLRDLILKYEMKENVVVASFNDATINYFRSLDSAIPTALAWNETLKFIIESALFVDFFFFPSAQVASIPMLYEVDKESGTGKLLASVPSFIRDRICSDEGTHFLVDLGTERIINDLHRQGIAVVYWTIDDEEDMEKLISLGADCIITDRPDTLSDILEGGN